MSTEDANANEAVTNEVEIQEVEEGQEVVDGEVVQTTTAKKKKKKKKKKPANAQAQADAKETTQAKKDMMNALYGYTAASSQEEAKKTHKFWNTQPVREDAESAAQHGEVETKTLEQVRKNPLNLPKGFQWVELNMADEKEAKEVYDLLAGNYVEDSEAMFRFNYSQGFLKWALMTPGYLEELHLGIRVTENKKLVAFISGIPVDMQVYKHTRKMVEINFLCVHKKLRSKRLAPVLIKEITRRTNLHETWQAVYTAGVVLPQPVAKNRYYHRSLNPRKLIEINFSSLKRNMTMQRTIKLNRLPTETVTPGFRLMKEEDHKEAHALLMKYLSKFDLYQAFTLEEFTHWFHPRQEIIYSYVVEHPQSHKITDFVSFYSLPSTVIGHPKHNILNAAYSFYNVPHGNPLEQLMRDALICAKNNNFDVFNCLDVMENAAFMKPLLFGQGDGNLQYYLYNWKCPEMTPDRVGLVLL